MKALIKRLLRENLIKTYPAIPDVVYHGQAAKYINGKRIEPEKFSSFDSSHKNLLDHSHVGFYFTPNKNVAYEYAGNGYVYTCKIMV